jgi:nitroreductase
MMTNRTSIREFIKDKKIPDEIMNEILLAAQKASTSFNLQTYCAISITNHDDRKRIAELSENQNFITEASAFLIICVDFYKMEIVNEIAGKDYYQKNFFESTLMGIVDASLFGQAVASAAESYDLGICFVGGIRSNIEKIDEILKLPPKVFPLLAKYDCISKNDGQYNNRQYKVNEFGFIDPQEYGWIEHSSRRTSTRDMNKVREDLFKYLQFKEVKI